jgi:uncharacterized membrane protein
MAVVAFLAALALVALAGPARTQTVPSASSGWTLCNQTSYVVEAAAGRPEGRGISVQGWNRLRPGECRRVVTAPLTRGLHYVYARTSTAHRGGRRQWAGAATLCVDPVRTFAIESPARCESMGLEARSFREVRINKRDSWRTILAEAEPYSLARARTAGLQRLLSDVGYEVRGRGDPRRMATAMARFREDARLAVNATEDQLIDELEKRAKTRAAEVGLTLCNQTKGRIFAAVARRRGEGWESRGWWTLGPQGCARTIDDPLGAGAYYIHAVLQTKDGERYLAAEGESFCVARTRFAILGREACDKRHYDAALFVPVRPPDRREGLKIDFQEREFLGVGAPPRQVVERAPEPKVAPVPPPPTRARPIREAAPVPPPALAPAAPTN